ncbi:hypothetical protein N7474_000160 [Penicillium riverlandense]|uniref:uncharacterized protein n=1 Tax=Penicillium riverlandense TaxID=1903569 RepID=UPI002547E023|nr:uncharacterized protein N7474_000160 [Penicillium riverlandense]KAJ5831849.1 hypothetical protein N7474_000160 [Penicillium riverlandense]
MIVSPLPSQDHHHTSKLALSQSSTRYFHLSNMKFQTPPIVSILLAATAYAAPATRHQTINPVARLTARDSINDCGDSSFTNESTGGGTWEVDGRTQHQLVQYGTCGFDVETKAKGFKIGNQDIIDLINSSIEQFQWNGVVGSKGDMSCQDLISHVSVFWGLYHT